MNHVADEILACRLEEALQIVEKAGVCKNIEIQYTAAPNNNAGGKGQERVVRFLLCENTGIITVIREA